MTKNGEDKKGNELESGTREVRNPRYWTICL